MSTSTLTVTYNRFFRPENTRGDRHFFSSPVSGLGIYDFITANQQGDPPVTKVTRLYEYSEFGDEWLDITGSDGNFMAGKGYNIDQASGSDGLLRFTGSVVNTASVPATSPYQDGYILRDDEVTTTRMHSGQMTGPIPPIMEEVDGTFWEILLLLQ